MITHDNALIINHPDTGFISVAGDESCAFLQSIITANVETLPVNSCRPSALLTPQGRILIDMMVYRPDTDRFILRCDSKRRDDLFAKLRRYRLRRPIEIAIEPEVRLFLVIKNKTATQSEKQTLGKILDQLEDAKSVIISCIDSRNPDLGTHILANSTKINATADQIDIWHTARIAAGIPEGPIDLTPERALMLEAGLDQLDAVDFKKGCYVGQENTARIKLKNKLSKRLFPIKIIDGKINENDLITYCDREIGKILITGDYPFAIVKFQNENFNFKNIYACNNGTLKIKKPLWY